MPKTTSSPIKYCASSYQLRSVLFAFAYTALLASVLGCANVNAQYNPAKPHHTPEGFKNNYADKVTKTGSDFLRWQYERTQAGLPKAPQTPTATVPAEVAFIHANAQPSAMQPAITWIGHATMLVQAGGLNVLTDPIFSERASPVQLVGPKRAQPPGLSLAQLPPIDVVLVSHNHYDHLDKNSVLALSNIAGAATLFIVPLGVKTWFESLGIRNVKELDWWDSATVKGVEFHLTPVQHWSARGLGDRSQTLWGGWAVFAPDFHWYYSGDAGYSKDFYDTQQRFALRQTPALGGGFDLALLAVGAYEPRWFMKDQHINPAEAVQVHRDLKAKRSAGLHWGTFELTDEPLDQPPKDLASARTAAGVPESDFFLLAVGETRKLPVRAPR